MVDVEHNYQLVPPSIVHILPSHRRINKIQVNEMDLTVDVGLMSKVAYDFMSLQMGDRKNLSYTRQDKKNYL